MRFRPAMLLLIVMSSSVAAEMNYASRIGVIAGAYQGEGSLNLPQTNQSSEDQGSYEPSYGGTAGFRLGIERLDRWQFDAAVEALNVEYGDNSEANRTDLVFSVGYSLLDWLTLLGGYRLGWQGDGFFDDSILSESGPWAGIGVGGMKLGSRIGVAASAAANFNRIDLNVDDGQSTRTLDFSYPGISLNTSFSVLGTPHSIRLRYQQFDGDASFTRANPDVQTSTEVLNLEVEETYVQLFYIYTLAN